MNHGFIFFRGIKTRYRSQTITPRGTESLTKKNLCRQKIKRTKGILSPHHRHRQNFD